MKKKKSLMFQFGLFFTLFALLTIIASSVMTYVNQTVSYHKECEESLRNITTHLSQLIRSEGAEFIYLIDYFDEHDAELKIPKDYTADIDLSRREFYKYVSDNYPDSQFGGDLLFPALDSEGKRLYVKYRFEYWLSVFIQGADNFDLSYIYFLYPSDTENHKVVYFLDPSLETYTDTDGKEYLKLADEVFEDPAVHGNMWKAWYNGSAQEGFDVIDNEFGYVYTYSYPLIINGQKVGLICADISVDYVDKTILVSALRVLLILAAVVLVATLLLSVFVRNLVLKRIVRLETDVKDYSATKDPAIAQKIRDRIKQADEIGMLSEQFAGMVTELEDYMIDLKNVTAEKERIGAELDVATHIQASMLPRIFPPFPDRKDVDIFATMDPAKEVGGDFYDFFLVGEDKLAVVIADVSGKGVPAALIMVIAKTLIKNHLLAGESIEEALIASNLQLLENNDEMLFVTAWAALIDLKTGETEFSEAGHEPAIIKRKDGSIEVIKPSKKKPPLATIEGTKYLKDSFTLNVGDVLFLYTDGVPEATNSNDELYTKERLNGFIEKESVSNLENLLKDVRADVDAFVGAAPQFDDLTMLAVMRKDYQ